MNEETVTSKDIEELLLDFKLSQKLLTAIGDEVRQHIIIKMLASAHSENSSCGGMRVGEITALTNLSRPAVSHHLQILKNAGLLKVRREGTKNFYYFDTDLESIDRLITMLERTKSIMALLPDRSGEDD